MKHIAMAVCPGPRLARSTAPKAAAWKLWPQATAGQQATEFDALLVPGGWAPDKLRRDKELLRLVRDMDAAGKYSAPKIVVMSKNKYLYILFK